MTRASAPTISRATPVGAWKNPGSLQLYRGFQRSGPLTVTQYRACSQLPGQLGVVMWRALVGRCPNCGQGKLFESYFKQVDHCAVCRERYGHIRSDDAAPWLTILVVGNITVPIILVAERLTSWPTWVSMTVWPAFDLALALVALPRAKAVFLSAIWAIQARRDPRKNEWFAV